MKRILSIFLTLSFLLIPLTLLAQNGTPKKCTVSERTADNIDICSGWSDKACEVETKENCAICCLFSGLYTVRDWIFSGVMVIATIMVIFGAFTITTAGGDPSKLSTGKNYILYAMIGFAIALLAAAIPNIVKALMGFKDATP